MATLLQKTIQKIKPLQEATSNKPKSSSANNLKLAAEFIGKVGIGAAVGALSTKARTDKQREDDSTKVSTENIQNKINKNISRDVTAQNHIENARAIVSQNYFNFLNNWSIEFGENATITDQFITDLLNQYTIEVALPTIDITTQMNDLVYIKNEDISNVSYNDISITFWLDEDMKIYKTLLKVINEMKDRVTGRLGYKDNYKWNDINVEIKDNVNSVPLLFTFENCIIKSIGEITLNKDRSDIKTISITLGYDRFYTDDEI